MDKQKDAASADVKSPISSPSTKPKNNSGKTDRSPKPKDGEKLRERLNKSKMVWRKESIEKRPRSGPMVAKHGLNKSSNLKLNTAIAKGNLRPTSPSYESAFKRQVVNRPVSPKIEKHRSFNRGRRPPSPNISVNPEELLKKRIEKAKKAKLYLLQQAGPNSFIIGGGDSEDHRHKVTIGSQSCSCGKGHHCIHILFVMVRVFQLSEVDNLMHSKILKNYEVESLFRKYEARRKQRLSRAHKPALTSYSSVDSDSSSAAGDSTGDITPESGDTQNKMEVTCPICLLDLTSDSQEQELVQCSDCHNKLHHTCMAYWYQLLKRQGDALNCPLCRAVWTSTNAANFEKKSTGEGSSLEPVPSPDVYSASPNSLGVSPVSGFADIEPSTLLPRSQPIPAEHTEMSRPWVEMFGEDLVGCLFMKNEWVVRETALRHLSREIIVFLTSSSPATSPGANTGTTSPSSEGGGSQPAPAGHRIKSIDTVLDMSCRILTMMMNDPVYKVYVSSLRALRTMLSYCSLPDVTKLKEFLQPVIHNIVLKCADGNRKTNQLSISTLSEFAKDQDGELAIAKELNVPGQCGLGGCIYILSCCVSDTDIDNTNTIQWLNGRLLTINQLLDECSDKFTGLSADSEEFIAISNDILLPIVEFCVRTLSRSGNPPRTVRYAKRVILQCAKYLSVLSGMNMRVRQLLTHVEPELRARLERRVMELAINAHQAAINSADRGTPADLSEPRVGSPTLSTEHSQIPKLNMGRSVMFGMIYTKQGKAGTEATAPTSRLPRLIQHTRSNSYTEAVYQASDEDTDTTSLEDCSTLSSNPTLNSTTESFLNFSNASSAFNNTSDFNALNNSSADFVSTFTAVQNSSLPTTPRSGADTEVSPTPPPGHLPEVTDVQSVDMPSDDEDMFLAPAGAAAMTRGDMDVVDGGDVVDGHFSMRPAAMSGLSRLTSIERASFDSVESVEADNLAVASEYQSVSDQQKSDIEEDHQTHRINSGADEQSMDVAQLAHDSSVNSMSRSENLPDAQDVTVGAEADETLTGSAGVIFSSEESDDDANASPDPKRKLLRGRAVSGSKPRITYRHCSDQEDSDGEVEGDGDAIFTSVDGADKYDAVDGSTPGSDLNGNLAPNPTLHRDTSYGFELQHSEDNWPGGDSQFQSIHPPSDSESGTTDNISQSVSLDMASTDESSDEDEMSEDGLDNKQLKKSTTNAPIPFREYKKKHSRSRTDPLKLSREVRSKSPRYHSDPQGNDSTTTSSSSTTPRTPPVSSSSPSLNEERDAQQNSLSANAAVSEKLTQPVSRSLTFSEPPRSPGKSPQSRHHSMRVQRGVPGSQIPRSKVKKLAAVVSPLTSDTRTEALQRAKTPADKPSDVTPVVRSKQSSRVVSITPAGTAAKLPDRSSSPVIPSAIRVITPPNSPLKDQSYRRSPTPPHSPPNHERHQPRPTSSPTLMQQRINTSPTNHKKVLVKPQRPASTPDEQIRAPSRISRTPSPPNPPATAIVRPQKGRASANLERQLPPSEGASYQDSRVPQVSIVPSTEIAGPSRPIQRQSSANVIGGILATSTSGSSEDHKTGSDSLYVDDLSDSAIASPYEKPVSFKDEVHLFSPRESPAKGGDCHCKDEVELEEAIALARAMQLSDEQTALPLVPGLSARRQEETITIHIQADQTDAAGDQVEYIENVHWRRGMTIGTGAFSTCYQCRDVKTGILMAVKQISFCRNSESEQDSICNAVIDEIRMMATLNHPNIVRILGATQTGAHFNMFVEWMPGGSVSHVLEKYGAFSEPVITSYTQQVLMGLAYLHDHQILHRDMKGANMLIDSTGKHLRIGDFGACAQLASSMTGAGELKGQLLGTIAFMAPEVLRGEHYGRACDVWSVGCVIIEMVTTKPPWNASNVSNHLKLIFMIASANDSPPIPENLPPAIKDLMLRCLEPDSKNRPPAKELLQHPLFTRSMYLRR